LKAPEIVQQLGSLFRFDQGLTNAPKNNLRLKAVNFIHGALFRIEDSAVAHFLKYAALELVPKQTFQIRLNPFCQIIVLLVSAATAANLNDRRKA
jgi:hypothetical protein